MMIRFFPLVLSAAILASCATGTPNIRPSENLMQDEGIVLTTCQTPNNTNKEIVLYPKGFKHQFMKFSLPPTVLCTKEGELAVIKLKAGEYYASTPLKTADKVGLDNLNKFTIQPSKINYIGDLTISIRQTNIAIGLLVGFDQPQINISASDRKNETLQRLQNHNPELLERYKVITSIAKK